MLRWFLALLFFGTALILIVAGGFLAGLDIHMRGVVTESPSWPTVQGRIDASGQVLASDVFQDERFQGPSSRGQTAYSPRIRYSYTVDGTKFISTRITYDPLDISGTQRLLDRFPKGATPNIYYNPDKHSMAVLIPGSKGPWPVGTFVGGAILAFGLFLAAIGVGVLYLMRKRRNRESVLSADS